MTPRQTSRSAGGIVLGDSGTIALVQHRDSNGAWLFPKGHIEPGETDEQAARREIEEETGLTNLELLDDLGSYGRYAITKDGKEDRERYKEIHMFLFAATPHAVLAPGHEIAEARWISLQRAIAEIGWPADSAWFARVFQRVRQALQRD